MNVPCPDARYVTLATLWYGLYVLSFAGMPMADNGATRGRYLLIEPVGIGGMGTVWRGRDTLLDREVAIKVIALPDSAERAGVYVRAVREARAAARIQHPNVVAVHDVIFSDDGQPPWIIMDFVRGRPMDAVIREDGPLPPARVADLAAQVLAGLAAGHAVGVLHRDLKPANVMVTSDGRALVTDFGIAKLVGDPQGTTQPRRVRGTPEYIPPERAWGEEGTTASDLFALGATMFAAFRGHGPFRGDSVDAALDAARHDDPPRVPEAGPLTDLIHALLSRDPARRPTAKQAARVLDAVIKGTSAPVIASAGRLPAGVAPEGMALAGTRLPGWTSADMELAGGTPTSENTSTLTAPPMRTPSRHRRPDVPGAPVVRRLGWRLRSRAGLWRIAAVGSVAVAVCIAGVITALRLTGGGVGGVASEGFQVTATKNGNEPEAFAVTNAHTLEYDSFQNGAGSGWQQLPGGGRYLGTPATVTDSAGRLEVFVRTTSGTIVRYYQSAKGANSWDGPESMGAERFTSDPSAVNWTNHGLVVFARLADGLLGIDSQTGLEPTASWSGWQSFGTIAIGQPVAVSNAGDGHPEVFAISGGSLVHAYNQGGGWGKWRFLAQGGDFTGAPAVSKDATGRVEVLVRTATGYLESFWQNTPGVGKWQTAPQPIGSGIVATPELVLAVGNQLEVFAERAGGSLWYSTQLQAASAEWSVWTSLPGRVDGVPAVVYASGRTDILADMGGSVYDIHSVGTSGWSGWSPLSGAP